MHVFRTCQSTIHQEEDFRRVLSMMALVTLLLVVITNFLRVLEGNLERSYVLYIVDLALFTWTCGTLIYFYWRQKRDPLKTRVVLTTRQIAIKRPGRPLVIINRRDCVAYGPLNIVLTFKDGSEYSLQKLPLPKPVPYALTRYIFTDWWPELSPKDAEREMRNQAPSFERHPEIVVAPAVVLFYMLLSYVVSADIGESIVLPFFCFPAMAISILWAGWNLWNAIKVYKARRDYRFDLSRGLHSHGDESSATLSSSRKTGYKA